MSFFARIALALPAIFTTPAATALPAVEAAQMLVPPPEAGTRTLRRGMAGPDVVYLQKVIGEAADGIFGRVTADALIEWQAEQKLVADGVAGPATWLAMGIVRPSAAPVFVAPEVASGTPLAALTTQVARALRAVGSTDPAGWAAVIGKHLLTDEGPRGGELAAFLSNIVNETGRLSVLVENLYYSKAERLCELWPKRFPTLADAAPFARNAYGLGEKVYGGRMGNGPAGSGDGYKHRGHGGMQTTGKTNLGLLAAAMGLTIDELLPLLAQRDGAIHSALFYWRSNRIGDVYRQGGNSAARMAVNGGTIGLKEVEALYPTIKAALAG